MYACLRGVLLQTGKSIGRVTVAVVRRWVSYFDKFRALKETNSSKLGRGKRWERKEWVRQTRGRESSSDDTLGRRYNEVASALPPPGTKS